MVEFEKLQEQIELGTLWLLTSAPLHRAFTPETWKVWRPHPRHFLIAVRLGLIEAVGYEVYRVTPMGANFKRYVDATVSNSTHAQEVKYG